MSTLKDIVKEHAEELSKETLVILLRFLLQRAEQYRSDAEEMQGILAEMRYEQQETSINRTPAQTDEQYKSTNQIDELKQFHVTGCVTDLCGGAPRQSIVDRLQESSRFDGGTCEHIIDLFKKAVDDTLLMAHEGFEPEE
jgi:hypothetical protein